MQKAVFLGVSLLLGCGGSEEPLESTDGGVDSRPVGVDAAVSSGDSQSLGGDGEVSSGGAFLAFTKASPDNPPKMAAFGIDQTSKVADAVNRLSSPSYSLEVLLDPSSISLSVLKGRLEHYRSSLGGGDTFVMYSHTHGTDAGLMIDFAPQSAAGALGWNDLAGAILALPARNVVVFTMSCHSGHLADALSALASTWKGQRVSAGRNLIVLTSVSSDQVSGATNYSTDTNAIGHPFTYAVRTALAGQADGFLDGVRNGTIEMDELVQYVLKTTKEKSTDQLAEPRLAGEYDPKAVFAPVPGA